MTLRSACLITILTVLAAFISGSFTQADDNAVKPGTSARYLAQWGSLGGRKGQFRQPGSIAVDGNGFVYVLDSGNNRVQKFDPNGRFITKWGSCGNGARQFDDPSGIAVDLDGNVYVADCFNERIQKFSSSGKLIAEWGLERNTGLYTYFDNGQLVTKPAGELRQQEISAKQGGHMPWRTEPAYVVWVMAADHLPYDARPGDLGWRIVRKGKWLALFLEAKGVNATIKVIRQEGNTTVVAMKVNDYADTEWTLDRPFGHWWYINPRPGGRLEPSGIAVGPDGDVYVTDTAFNQVQKFNSSGKYLCQWGSSGNETGKFDRPTDIAVDRNGNVYVLDPNNARVQKFNPDGTFLTKWGTEGSGEGEFYVPEGLGVDSEGNVYVADTRNNRIEKFDSEGSYITQWGSKGNRQGQFNWPEDIAVDSKGSVYVADTHNNRIQRFTQ